MEIIDIDFSWKNPVRVVYTINYWAEYKTISCTHIACKIENG